MANITPECENVVNYIIQRLKSFNADLDNYNQHLITAVRIQKILYFCDIEYMKKNNGLSMFKDDFYAWPKGPAIPPIYFGFLQSYNGEIQPTCDNSCLTSLMIDAIECCLENILNYDTVDLVLLSQAEEGPWKQFYRKSDPHHLQIIPKAAIYNFYLNKKLFNCQIKEKTL